MAVEIAAIVERMQTAGRAWDKVRGAGDRLHLARRKSRPTPIPTRRLGSSRLHVVDLWRLGDWCR